ETGTVSKFNKDGSITVDVGGQKRTIQPEAVEFLGPEPLGKPSPGRGSSQGQGRPEPPLPTDPAEKLVTLIKAGKVAVKQTSRLRHPEAVRRSQEIDRIFQGAPGEKGLHEALTSLKGEMPRADLLREAGFGQGEIDGLFQRIQTHPDLTPFERLDAQKGLAKLLDKTSPHPEASELSRLEEVFGRSFVDTVKGVSRYDKFWRGFSDIINVPRAFAASFDMSAPLRQGLILTASHPVKAARAFAEMHRYFFSSKHFEGFVQGLRAEPTLPIAREVGLHLASLSGGSKKSLAGGEEVFRSLTAENIPILGRGVKASER